MFEDRFGGEDIGGFGDGVEFGYMTDDDLAALGAIAEFERSDPDDRDFVASVPVESRVAKKRAAEDTWWRAASSRRKLMDDVSERFRGPAADMDCIQAALDDLGIILEPHKDGLRGPCPDDEHFSNSKKPFHVSSSGWCYCFACAQSKGAGYRGSDVVSFYKEHAGHLSPKEAYARLADIAHIDVREYSQDAMADERVREASRYADREGKYTWSDVKRINEIKAMPLAERRDYMRRQSIVEIRRKAQGFYQACLVSPERTLVDPVRRRLERAQDDAEDTLAEKRKVTEAMSRVRENMAINERALRKKIAEIDGEYSAGKIDRELHDLRCEDMARRAATKQDQLEVSLESGQARLVELEAAVKYHEGNIKAASNALQEAEATSARSAAMAEYLVSCGVANRNGGTLSVPAGIGYAPPIKDAAVHYLLSSADGSAFSPGDVRASGIGQMSTKRQVSQMRTEDALYDRITFPMYSATSGNLTGFAGIRPDATEDKVRYMCSGPATCPDGERDLDPQVAFDWKRDIYNALFCAPAAIEAGSVYVANNPLDVEVLKAAGVENACSPARGGDQRGELGCVFHFRSHEESVEAIAAAISPDSPIEIRWIGHEEAMEIASRSRQPESALPRDPVREEIEQIEAQAKAASSRSARPPAARRP